ncbi:MAG: phosphoheptose isomerase [Opitutus sp.]|nr:phosphoheptose isomerase [Opitutus sp.]
MNAHRQKLILLPPNRVWRPYPGGRTLEQLAGAPQPADSFLSEEWIGSTTRAVSRGREAPAEGLSQVRVGHDPALRDFATLLASDPEYFLGAAHVKKFGAQPQVLVKFLDSGTRLYLQVHPTREFALRFLGAPSGKTEAYYVLDVRDPASAPEPVGYVFVGFQRPPTPAALREFIVTQNIAALEACFDPIAVRPGDILIIPGGTPHALGAGVFMVEIQEPSDLVVRFEFERAGYVLPEASRFMGRDLDFALTVFNFAPLTLCDVDARIRCQPRRLRVLGPGSWQDELIGAAQTDCFRVTRTHLGGPVLKDETSFVIAIVTAGAVMVEAGGESHRFNTYDKLFFPAGLGPVKLTPVTATAEILECRPPAA